MTKIALAALIAVTLTGAATAGECRLACNGETYVDFTNPNHVQKLGWKDAKVAEDHDSCKELIDRATKEKSTFLTTERAKVCPAGTGGAPFKGLPK